jgi:chromosome partitioning protein
MPGKTRFPTCNVIAIAMGKGGVGKSTVCLSLAFSAAKRGFNTAIIDGDPQANVTGSLMDIDESFKYRNAYHLIADSDPVEPVPIRDDLALIPAANDLTLLDKENDLDLYFRLRDRIHELYDGRFDYMIIDTPGVLRTQVISTLAAADAVVIPIQLTDYSLQALFPLYELIKTVKRRMNPSLRELGILPNMITGLTYSNTPDGDPVPATAKERQIYTKLIEQLGRERLLGVIATRTCIKNMISSGRPIWEAPKDDSSRHAVEELEGFAENVFRHFPVPT